MRCCALFFSCFPHELDTVCPTLDDSVHKNYVISSVQITLVTFVTGFRSAVGGSETGNTGKEEFGRIPERNMQGSE